MITCNINQGRDQEQMRSLRAQFDGVFVWSRLPDVGGQCIRNGSSAIRHHRWMDGAGKTSTVSFLARRCLNACLWPAATLALLDLLGLRIASDLDYGNDRLAMLPAMIVFDVGQLRMKERCGFSCPQMRLSAIAARDCIR